MITDVEVTVILQVSTYYKYAVIPREETFEQISTSRFFPSCAKEDINCTYNFEKEIETNTSHVKTVFRFESDL